MLAVSHSILKFIKHLALKLSPANWFRRFTVKLFEICTFAMYIRVIMEAYLFINISVVSEFSEFNTNGSIRVLSLSMNFVLTILLVFLILLAAFEIRNAHILKEYNSTYFTEFHAGLKPKTLSRSL